MPRITSSIEDHRGRVICERCAIADRALARLRGLLGRSELPPGEGLLLRPSPSVHTCFMRFPIDVVFLDRHMRVLDARAAVRPWRVAGHRGARAVLELRAGEARRRGVRAGDRLMVVPATAGATQAGGER